MAIYNITDSALLVKKSRRTIQRYIANGKLTMVRDTLGKPQIDTTELIRVFGTLSKVSQNKIAKKSHNVAVKSSRKKSTVNLTHDELESIINRAVEKALAKAIPLLIEHQQSLPTPAVILEGMPEAAPAILTQTVSVDKHKTKATRSLKRPFLAKNKEPKNGYAAAFGLPNVITEVIHLDIMKRHGEGLTSREIAKKVGVSQESIQRTINAST
jgi:predicted DNA-binding protein (UPF0251 family)